MGWQWVGNGLVLHPCKVCKPTHVHTAPHLFGAAVGTDLQYSAVSTAKETKRNGVVQSNGSDGKMQLPSRPLGSLGSINGINGINRMGKLQGLWNKSIGLNLIGNIHPSPPPHIMPYLLPSSLTSLKTESRAALLQQTPKSPAVRTIVLLSTYPPSAAAAL